MAVTNEPMELGIWNLVHRHKNAYNSNIKYILEGFDLKRGNCSKFLVRRKLKILI
jgi:hypothetical protein